MPFAEGTPTAKVELGGKSYDLGFTIGAMKRAKELGVLNLDVMDGEALMLSLPEYVWVCLEEEARNEISVKQIDELIHPKNAPAIASAIVRLFKESLPDPDPNAEPAAVKEPTAGNQTSSNSGQLASMTSG